MFVHFDVLMVLNLSTVFIWLVCIFILWDYQTILCLLHELIVQFHIITFLIIQYYFFLQNEQTSEAQNYLDDSFNLEESSIQQYLLPDSKEGIRSARKRRKTKHHKKGESSQSKVSEKEDDWLVVGKSIGIQLRGLDNDQVVITQKLISDAIFYAKLGRLTEDSFIALSEPNDYLQQELCEQS